jgi:hypothetical protein
MHHYTIAFEITKWPMNTMIAAVSIAGDYYVIHHCCDFARVFVD